MSEFYVNWEKVKFLRLYLINHVAKETTKMSIFTCQSKSFIRTFFTCQASAWLQQPFSCHDLANDIQSQTAKTVFSHLNRRLLGGGSTLCRLERCRIPLQIYYDHSAGILIARGGGGRGTPGNSFWGCVAQLSKSRSCMSANHFFCMITTTVL